MLLIFIPAYGLVYTFRTRERGLPGVAVIVEKEERPFRGAFYTWVEFAGRRCRVIVPKDIWREIRPGANLDILYDPEQPGQLQHVHTAATPHATLIYASLMVLGLLFGAVAWRLWFV